MRILMMGCCVVVALCSAARAADYVLSFELREYRGRQAHETVAPVFGAKAIDVDSIWDALKKLDYSTLTEVEVPMGPHAKHRQHTRLGAQLLDVTISTGDLHEGRESSVIELRYRDDERVSEVKNSCHWGVVNRPWFLHAEVAKLRRDQSEVTLLWIATLKTVEGIGPQNGAGNRASPRR